MLGDGFTAFLEVLGKQTAPPAAVSTLQELGDTIGEAVDTAVRQDAAKRRMSEQSAMIGLFVLAAVILWVRPWS